MRGLATFMLLSLASCGAPLDRHAAYGRIQVEEARIVHASSDTSGAACPEICSASEAIEAQARLLDEADARTRAERAARTCASCGAAR